MSRWDWLDAPGASSPQAGAYPPPPSPPPSRPGPMRQSELGIAGLIVGGVGAILVLIAFLSFVIHEGSPTSHSDGEAVESSIGLLMIASPWFGLIGLALSLIGLFQRNRYKLMPILGLVFSAIPVLSCCCLGGFGFMIATFGLQ